MDNPSISVCIPAYKNKAFLKRLLDSIKIQSYKNFEVVITDDSPDDDLFDLCQQYNNYFEVTYFKNSSNLNTPENWNEAVKKARYDWIKIIHDDDWFVHAECLSLFAKAIVDNPSVHFFFSAYQNIYLDDNRSKSMYLSFFWSSLLRFNPEVLISKNAIGPPSVILYHKSMLQYDKEMKYVVDIDFYTRYLSGDTWAYIPSILINVGIHSSQVTKYTFGFSEFQFKEGILMLKKKNQKYFLNLVAFDGWWRLLRNFEITSAEIFQQYSLSASHLGVINEMIDFQNYVGRSILKNGLVSKFLMFLAYIKTVFSATT
jgi:glycosyltransferase involved in cell wall biosynthesis